MKKDTLIIIPAYNEEASIGAFLDSILASEINTYADIFVINDASSDRTREMVQDRGIPVASHPYNLGYGQALQTGYKYATCNGYDYVIQIDGDGQHDACNIHKIYSLLHQKNTAAAPDLIIGSRFLKDSQSFSVSFFKKVGISFFRKFIRITSGQKISDPTSGLQGMTYPVFSYYASYGNFDSNYPDANMIVQMLLLGFRIEEFPAVMHDRKAGKSMHFGILEPIFYMFVMVFSTCNIYLRHKLHILPTPKILRGDATFEEK